MQTISREQRPAPAAPAAPLSAGFKPRHLSMMALGGVIGAGLFVGSGGGITAAGPGILVSYLLAGVLVMLVMRMLGEMSAAMPDSGSFSVYAQRAFGRSAGFVTGWLYWALIVVGVAMEAIAAGNILNSWIPAVPAWAWVLLCMTVVTVSNMATVGVFGEVEFWLAGLKVAAIVAFLALGSLAIVGALPGAQATGLDNLTAHGGFLPHGFNGVIIGLLAAVTAFAGLEVVTIAAAESPNPARAIARAVRTTVWRIAIFLIGSMAVVVTLLPWNDSEVGQSPYVAVLHRTGVPAAGQIMNVVVLFALLSAMNANLYTTSRMLFSLAQRGEAPAALVTTSRRKVPYLGVLASAAFGFVSVVLSVIWPDTIFQFMINSVGAVGLIVWALIAASQLRLRRQLHDNNDSLLTVRMWGFPYLSWLTIAGIATVLVLMAHEPSTRSQVMCTALLAGALWVTSALRQRRAPHTV